MVFLAAVSASIAIGGWIAVLLLPWQPHRTRERLEPNPLDPTDLRDVVVLIPARDEAETIGTVIAALGQQGAGLEVVVVDDQSTDGTADLARRAAAGDEPIALRVLAGAPLPDGWAGKLWALEQGLAAVDRPFVLLLDADIELAPRMVPALLAAARARGAALVSVMALLHCTTLWEKLLSPPFVYFFKLLYPFALANDPRRKTAAAAGGCILVRTAALRALGGFGAIRGALIDDCTLAGGIKRGGGVIWLGLSRSVLSLRVYGLHDFWRMVSRSAFTQLRYSTLLLLLASALLVVMLLAPPWWALAGGAALAAGAEPAGGAGTVAVAALAWAAMTAAYWPTVRFYRLSVLWALTLPLAGALFLAMTWTSAASYWRGTRATWKNRTYGNTL